MVSFFIIGLSLLLFDPVPYRRTPAGTVIYDAFCLIIFNKIVHISAYSDL